MTGRVERAFTSLMVKAYGGPMGGVQEAELRKAFYAGVYWMQVKLPEELDPGVMETGRDLQIMQEVHDEIIAFVGSLFETSGNA